MSLPEADSGSIPQPGAKIPNTQERTITTNLRLSVDMDTHRYQDLVLRQLVRQIPQWFSSLTPMQITEVLHSEADNIHKIYPGGIDYDDR